jgi:hypothetical protein
MTSQVIIKTADMLYSMPLLTALGFQITPRKGNMPPEYE